MDYRRTLLAAGVLGITGIALGAFGAHAFAAGLAERGMTRSWESASRYHLLHAVALLGLAIWQRQGPHPRRAIAWAARLWVVGTVLFSGSLYALALGGGRWFGPVTPLGGVAFMAGWALIAAAAWMKEE